MNENLQTVAEKSLKVAGALAVATGVVAVGAVVASGAAVGAMVEGFKAAGDAVKKVLEEDKMNEDRVDESTDVVTEESVELAAKEEVSQERVITEEV